MRSLFAFQITFLSKILGGVIPGSKGQKGMNVLKLEILNENPVFRIVELVIDSVWKYLLTMPAVPALEFYLFIFLMRKAAISK